MTSDSMIGRFDDPTHDRYRTLYASESAEGALREKLLGIRPDPLVREKLAAMELSDEERQSLSGLTTVPESFLRDFVLTTFEVQESRDVVPVTETSAFDAYLDHSDQRLTLDVVLDTTSTEASQRMGAKIWQQGYAGVCYPSRHGSDIINYALFEEDYRTDRLRVPIRQVDIQSLDENCSVLATVARDLGLSLSLPATYDTKALWVHSLRDALEKINAVEWYVRPRERGVHYYSMRIPGMKLSVVTFGSNASIEVDAVTSAGGAHVLASTSSDVNELLHALASADPSVAQVLTAALSA